MIFIYKLSSSYFSFIKNLTNNEEDATLQFQVNNNGLDLLNRKNLKNLKNLRNSRNSINSNSKKWPGRRKQRRFENDNFINFSNLISPPNSPYRNGNSSNFSSYDKQPQIFMTPIRESCFKNLIKNEPGMVEVFINCEQQQIEMTTPRTPMKDTSNKQSIISYSLSPTCSETKIKKNLLQKINKKTRKALKKKFSKFVIAIENAFQQTILNGKLENIEDVLSSSSLDPPIIENNNTLVLCLRNGFLRLLVHGIADFYSTQCKSINNKGKRITKVFFLNNTNVVNEIFSPSSLSKVLSS